jgi:hypothetical protein
MNAVPKSILHTLMLPVTLLALISVSGQTKSSQSANEQPTQQGALQIKALIEKECQKVEVECPFDSRQLRTRESTAFVEQAIQNGLSSFIHEPSNVSINGNKVLLQPTPLHPSFIQGWWSAEAYLDALSSYYRSLKDLENIKPVLIEGVRLMFTEKMEVTVEIVSKEMEGDWALNAQGEATSKDLFDNSGGKIDYQAQWYKVKSALRENELNIYREESNNGKFSLETTPIASSDSDWLYQSFHRISMWDPYRLDSQHSAQYLIVEVLLVVKKRKQLGPFIASTRSGPEEDRILQFILNKLNVK